MEQHSDPERVGDAVAFDLAVAKIWGIYIDCKKAHTPITHDQAIERSGVTDPEVIEEARSLMLTVDILRGAVGKDDPAANPDDRQIH